MIETPRPPSERIHEYLENHPELTKVNAPKDRIKIPNLQAFKEKLVSTVKGSIDKYLQTAQSTDTNERIMLKEVVLDESIPLHLQVLKTFRYTSEGEFISDRLEFFIKKPGEDKSIGEFVLRDYGDEFRLSHRKVNPQYQGNGIANTAMKAIEEFIKAYVKKVPNREPVIEANAAQLDVLSWFSSNGFETNLDPFALHPGENEFKVHDLNTVLTSLETGDGEYEVGPYLYVFPTAFKGPHIIEEGIGAEGVNIDESALVHFRKRLDIGDHDIDEITRDVRSELNI